MEWSNELCVGGIGNVTFREATVNVSSWRGATTNVPSVLPRPDLCKKNLRKKVNKKHQILVQNLWKSLGFPLHNTLISLHLPMSLSQFSLSLSLFQSLSLSLSLSFSLSPLFFLLSFTLSRIAIIKIFHLFSTPRSLRVAEKPVLLCAFSFGRCDSLSKWSNFLLCPQSIFMCIVFQLKDFPVFALAIKKRSVVRPIPDTFAKSYLNFLLTFFSSAANSTLRFSALSNFLCLSSTRPAHSLWRAANLSFIFCRARKSRFIWNIE